MGSKVLLIHSKSNLKKGAVGVIPISSAITKYNVECGAPGMVQRDGWLRDFLSNEKVVSVVLLLDTPGGEVRASDTFVATMQSAKKPIISYIDGGCYSLGMFFAAASDKTYFSSENGELGSIGTLMRFMDFTEMMEKQGIKMHEVYAPQSTDKNKDFKDAMKGDYTAIEEDLRIITDRFINHIKTNRPQAAKSQDKWGTGKTFRAQDAIKLGLADGIVPFNKMISYSQFLARTKNKK